MPLDAWLKDNWGWFGAGAAAMWGAFQWLRTERRSVDAAAATREDAERERMWARLNTYIDDMESVVKALRVENGALHEEVGAYRRRVVELEDVITALKRQVQQLVHEVEALRHAREGVAIEDHISDYVRGARRS